MTTQTAEQNSGRATFRQAALPDGSVPREVIEVARQALVRMIVDRERPRRSATREERHELGATLIGMDITELGQRWREASPEQTIVAYEMGEINSTADRKLTAAFAGNDVDGIMIFTRTPKPTIFLYNQAGVERATERIAELSAERPLDENDGLARDSDGEDYQDPRVG